jgi:rhomboid protease GluP
MLTMDQEIASDLPDAEPLRSRPSSNGSWSKRSDLVRFRRALFAGTPRLVMTPLFVVACAGVYLAMVLSGVPLVWPTGPQLIRWGANEGTRIILRHEYWRLITMVFVHGGLIHLVVNMWSLAVIGPLVERLYGTLAFAIIYLAAGVGGALASVAASPSRISVGASGAICGVLGALLAFLIVHRRTVAASVRVPLLFNLAGVVVFMGILSYFVPNIDQEAHLGGVTAGFICGLLLTRPWPVTGGRGVALRRAAASVAISLVLVGSTALVTRLGAIALRPDRQIRRLEDQTAPALADYNDIVDAMPATMSLSRDRDDPAARAKHDELIHELIARARTNALRLRSISTLDRELRTVVGYLIGAQSSQIEALDAALRYLETGDPELLNGERGVLGHRAAASRLFQAFQTQKKEYVSVHGLAVKPTEPAPSPGPDRSR